MEKAIYPFAAIVGQEELKLSLILCAIYPRLSGVLIQGDKGTAKSTAVRGMAQIMPTISQVDDVYHLSADEQHIYGDPLGVPSCTNLQLRQVPVVELPVGVTEDRVAGTLDVATALVRGQQRFQPGLLASAHRGILYVDEVNLLDDHIVDILLDSADMGVNTVEREGMSVIHPSRFSLVGTMNPEEGSYVHNCWIGSDCALRSRERPIPRYGWRSYNVDYHSKTIRMDLLQNGPRIADD